MNKSILITFAIVLLGVIVYSFTDKTTKEQEVYYEDYKVLRMDLQINTRSSGDVEPEKRIEVRPPIDGRIEEVLVKEGEKVKRGEVLAWMSSTERAALLDAARSKGEEELNNWKELYRPTPIISPTDGTVIRSSVSVGQTFNNSEAVFVVSNKLLVRAEVNETDLSLVKKGIEVKIVIDAYPDKPIQGKVSTIAYEAILENNVKSYTVEIIPNETPDYLRSGMTTTLFFDLGLRKNVIAIPNSTIFFDGQSPYVLKEIDGDIAEVNIKLGKNNNEFTEVLSGLEESDLIKVKKIKFLNNINKKSPLSGF